ncbi:disease resistance protein (TIR-NBS-LRR class) [Trifolium pratense]|uniref:Disease resistance protein (TIR-NBS-LRR class) n=1 Tax=Trifolium pratense TaxID=57577 RepID=A0A2K3PHI2_TRIPR|nr:disease resistance protein (TIR-NBS-LRR class) [Trifolium pratense]
MECHRTVGQVVVPVFYHVDPSEVRHQKGEFGLAFQRLLNKISNEVELVRSWRKTLCQAANIAGFVILKTRNECEYIKDIVDKVSRLLNKTDLFIANNPVGIESRVQDMIQLLNPQSNRVLLLGMWGMGGIGKTTIAKAIYNKIGRNFESRSFLEDIREVGETLAGQVSLQKQLLCDVYKERTIKIANIDSGKILLKDILSCREVFIVLDDVSTLDQLNILCGSREWFGSGSIIIITTRDLHLLRGRVDKIYEMTIMNEHESLELFSWNAFKQASPKGDFVRISKDVVEYSKGLPLALEVLGSYLFNRTESQWELVLEKLRRIPNVKVQNKLRISYDGLDDDDQQEIFLDIACFLIGMDRDDVILILNDCGLSAEIGISVLVERSLVTIDYRNRLGMHDLLRDMGREIIREESPRRPEERSRLWFHEDVIDVLSKQNGKGNVTGLALKLPRGNAKCFRTKAFENMERLRLLQLDEVKLDGDFEYVSRDLRWLSWNRLSHLPTNFYRENLVSLELEHCNFELVWKKTLRMEKLKILNLSHSHRLTQSPDFSNMPNLEKLVLKDCRKLSEIDKLEEDLEQMESLTALIANNTAITRVPFSVNMDVNGNGGCFLPGDSYPYWLIFYSRCSSVTFEVPQLEGRNLNTLMCVVYTSTPDNITSDGLKNVLVKNYTKATIQVYKREALGSFEDEEWKRVVSSIEPGSSVEVIFVFENDFIVEKTAVYLVYDAHDLNVACRGDENERSVKRFSTEDEATDDFNQNRKKKNRVE